MTRSKLASQTSPARHHRHGFALPTILISSIVMLIILLVSVSSTAAVRTAIKNQYYTQLAQVSGEAGVAYAKACLAANGNVPLWSNANPLTPSSDCTGTSTLGDTAQVLVVAGGGSGGNHNTTNGNGGGGGGGVIYNSSVLATVGSYPVTVGNGGVAIANATCARGNNGQNSVFGTLTAIGGGGGGSTCGFTANGGGSGGGAATNYPGAGSSTQTGGFGNVGGASGVGWTGAGGGGAGSAGVAGTTTSPGGNGGSGYASAISGSTKYYAGGGGGGGNSSERAGDGFDGGGRGSGTTSYYNYSVYTNEVNATTRGSGIPTAIANTGGGGGGGSYWAANGGWATGSGAGATGIVVVSYVTGSITATGGTITTSGGRTIHTFTSSGTFAITVGANACPSNVLCSVVTNGNIHSGFSIGMPALDSGGKATTIPVNGYVQLLRTSDSAVWRQYNQKSVNTLAATKTTTVTFNPTGTGQTGTIQTWTVPATGTYTIEASGAQGGQGTSYTQYYNGKGARMKGDFSLTAGQVIKILVGQQGPSGGNDGGGGGGSFVTTTGNAPLVVAGGGGGSSYGGPGNDGWTSTGGQAGPQGGTGGTGGGGGTTAAAGYAGSGGGLTGTGGNGPAGGSACNGGLAFVNGGNGGCTASNATGGFGGGGGTHGGGWGGGGGGGYSGGGASTSYQYGGGGGGSYNAGVNQSNTAGVKTGSGLVTIQYTSPVVRGAISCPTGYIVVPGSSTYGTSSFCVMKYEASNSAGTAVSVSGALPWANISQITSISTANAACSACHLITESEWLTIAQNVLSVPSNWSGGSVGSGLIYSGHNDNLPVNSLAADAIDANGYSGTGNSAPSNQRRTLTLTNGEVIWDLAGNLWEWTSGTSTTGQPGSSGYGWREWNGLNTSGSLSPSPMPSFGTPAASGWNSTQNIGQIYSNSGETALRGFLRGGFWNFVAGTGVLAMNLNDPPSNVSVYVGFRVAR